MFVNFKQMGGCLAVDAPEAAVVVTYAMLTVQSENRHSLPHCSIIASPQPVINLSLRHG